MSSNVYLNIPTYSDGISLSATNNCPVLDSQSPSRIYVRVEIGFSQLGKHTLPVGDECTFSHRNALPKASNEVCLRRDGLEVRNGVSTARKH